MKIALGIQYIGTNYHGWQHQKKLNSVQDEVEKAVSKIADHKIKLVGSSRTDSGVHAAYQVAHFETIAIRGEHNWLHGVNRHLPEDISLLWAKQVDDDFHARFSAKSRMYRYIIYNLPVRSSFWGNYTMRYSTKLNEKAMKEALNGVLGKHDFSALRSAYCQSKTPIRNIMHCDIRRFGDFVVFDIKANAFLHHMVRKFVAILVEIGAEKYPPALLYDIIKSQDRQKAKLMASASGLFLYDVEYDDQYFSKLKRPYHMVNMFD